MKVKLIHTFLIGALLSFLVMYYFALEMQEKYENKIDAILKLPADTLSDASIMYYLQLFDVPHSNIVLKQARLESGNYKSELCVMSNNLFGLKRHSTGNYFHFNHWIESIVMYKWLISYKYEQGCYYKFLEELPYAEDNNYINKLKSL